MTLHTPMFTDADRLCLFTRAEVEVRLNGVCSVDWFLRAFSVPVRCKGRVIAGADIVKALANPPAPETEEAEPVPAVIADIRPTRRIRRGTTCATIEPLRKRREQ